MPEYIDILDENGNNKGYKKLRTDILEENEYSKVIHVWIRNSKGLFLVQQRAKFKKVDPNLWSITAGFVSSNETTIDALKRELMEELSYELDESKIRYLFTLYPKKGIHHIADIFVLDEDIDIDDVMAQFEEVQSVFYVSKEEILEGIETGIFNNFNNMYEDYYKKVFEVI